jgi:hypothetical protein
MTTLLPTVDWKWLEWLDGRAIGKHYTLLEFKKRYRSLRRVVYGGGLIAYLAVNEFERGETRLT